MSARVRKTLATHRLTALWGAMAASIAGQLLDLRWHLAHDEFETASDQLQAHWLSWIGAMALLAVAADAVRRERRGRGAYMVIAYAAGLYLAVAVWHFIAHDRGSDPELAHLFIAVAKIAAIAGAVAATVSERRHRCPAV